MNINKINNSRNYLAILFFIIMPMNGMLMVELNVWLGLFLILCHIPWFVDHFRKSYICEEIDQELKKNGEIK